MKTIFNTYKTVELSTINFCGMADAPIAEINHQTILEYAQTPMMDMLSKKSEIGLAHTIPKGMKPGRGGVSSITFP